MNKKSLFLSCSICLLLLLSACSSQSVSSSSEALISSSEESSQAAQAVFKVRMNNNGATLTYERDQTSYYVGDLVKFKLDFNEGFTLKEISWNNKDVAYDEFEDYPYSFTAATSNNIKITLNTNLKISGTITFDGVALTETEADSIGIRAVDSSEKYYDGTILYDEGTTTYKISNLANDTSYTIQILGYLTSEKTSPFVYETFKATVEAESVTKNINVNAKKVLQDTEYGAKLPSSEGATAKMFAVEHKGAGYLINDFTIELKIKTHLSDLTAEGSYSVSHVFQLSGMAEGISTSNAGFTQFRIMYQDIKNAVPSEQRKYTLQKCGDGWTSFDLEEYFTQAQIEDANSDVSVLVSFSMTGYTVYFAVNGNYVQALTFNSSWRLFPKYVDSGVWGNNCKNNTSSLSLKMYGSCPNPSCIEGYTQATKIPE